MQRASRSPICAREISNQVVTCVVNYARVATGLR